VTVNRTCVLLASEDMITQRIDAHLARAKRAYIGLLVRQSKGIVEKTRYQKQIG